MFWEEDEDKTLPYVVPDDIIDINFAIECKTLPLDHAWALSCEITSHLPWIEETPGAGIHQIHVAESNNGWLRPDESEDNPLLYPSRRTRLTLRIPGKKQQETETLTGKTLALDGHTLTIGKSRKKPLTNSSVIFARYVATDTDEDENAFLGRMHSKIKEMTGVAVKKMLCGKSHTIQTPNGPIQTRHLMIADLDSDPSVKIQQQGLGKYRELGCGLFLPHKGIKTLKPVE